MLICSNSHLIFDSLGDPANLQQICAGLISRCEFGRPNPRNTSNLRVSGGRKSRDCKWWDGSTEARQANYPLHLVYFLKCQVLIPYSLAFRERVNPSQRFLMDKNLHVTTLRLCRTQNITSGTLHSACVSLISSFPITANICFSWSGRQRHRSSTSEWLWSPWSQIPPLTTGRRRRDFHIASWWRPL